jgi:hypothetical protein
MTDRELLELAAKAVGSPQGTSRSGGGLLMANDLYWNPLTDDGDALRLAVKLEIDVVHSHGTRTAVAENTSGYVAEGSDPYAATRIAIVKVAAEIAKGMK